MCVFELSIINHYMFQIVRLSTWSWMCSSPYSTGWRVVALMFLAICVGRDMAYGLILITPSLSLGKKLHVIIFYTHFSHTDHLQSLQEFILFNHQFDISSFSTWMTWAQY